jgi:thiamine-monophosphate kinase
LTAESLTTTSPSMAELGEKEFISQLLKILRPPPSLIGGYGHDAAAIDLPAMPVNLMMKIDRASHPLALKRNWAGYDSWGRMAVTANCSDVLASGGTPIAVMICVMSPGEQPSRDVLSIITGAVSECDNNKILYAGGDTKEAQSLEVVGTAVGTVPEGGFLPRDTAEPGDLLYCGGPLGGFAGSFFLLDRVPGFAQASESAKHRRYLAAPRAQWEVARAVNGTGLARCGMDASDGLFDVLQTFARPGLSVSIDLDRLPYHKFALQAERECRIPRTQLIFGGGDWTLLYCVPPSKRSVAESIRNRGVPLFHIGEFSAGEGAWAIDRERRVCRIEGPVNEHFKKRIEDGKSFMQSIAEGNFLC